MGRNVNITCDHCGNAIGQNDTYHYGAFQKRTRNTRKSAESEPAVYLCDKCFNEIFNKGEKVK